MAICRSDGRLGILQRPVLMALMGCYGMSITRREIGRMTDFDGDAQAAEQLRGAAFVMIMMS